jgi:hypothetical protein
VVRGLQKFSDQSDIKSLYDPGAWDRTQYLVFSEKANGENVKVVAKLDIECGACSPARIRMTKPQPFRKRTMSPISF